MGQVPHFLLSQHERAESHLRLIRVVRAAAQLQVVDRRRAAQREGFDVVQLEKAASGAPAVSPDERTLTAVTGPTARFTDAGT